MGVFDTLICEMPLPGKFHKAGDSFQTKDIDAAYMSVYKLDKAGYLWFQTCEYEDRSALGKWRKDHPNDPVPPDFKTIDSIIGAMTPVNINWKRYLYTGDVRFYDYRDSQYIEYFCRFIYGKTCRINLVRTEKYNEKPPVIEIYPTDTEGEICTTTLWDDVDTLTKQNWTVSIVAKPDSTFSASAISHINQEHVETNTYNTPEEAIHELIKNIAN